VVTLINIELYVMNSRSIWCISFWYPCVFPAFVYTSLTNFTGLDLTEDQLVSIKRSQMSLEDYGSFLRLFILFVDVIYKKHC
jgi:hypothetical protein